MTSPHDTFDVEDVIREASLSEKISLLAGDDFWHTVSLPRFKIPQIRLSDGPNGVRGTKFFNGVPAACLPCGTGLAATWDTALLYKAGTLIGEECKAKGAHCWLGPTVCIQRSPLGGRGFESLAEDPYATGKLAAAYINGVQSTGVIATIKHFLANDQEHERVAVNVMVSERAMREIHLLPFQIAISDSSPGALMSCYNKVNGTHVSESKELIENILRHEWGWKGLVMSDWWGTYSTSEALNAGLDLEMPGPSRHREGLAHLAVSSRKVTTETIDARVRNVLEFVKRATNVSVSTEEGTRDHPEDRALNRRLAADSLVLLKNESNILPLKPGVKSIALIGPNMKIAAFCGGGSAALQPYYAISPFQGITDQLSNDVNVKFEVGAYSYAFVPLLEASPSVTTPEGQPGLRMRFYREPPSTPDRPVIEELILPDSAWELMDFSHPDLGKLYYADVEASVMAPTTGPYEFAVAVHGTANVFIDDELIIDNSTVQRGGSYCFGKGTVEEKATVQFTQGRQYKLRVEYASAPSSKLVKPGVVAYGAGAGRLGMIEVVAPELLIARAVEAARKADVAVICAGLTKDHECEGYDRAHMDLPGSVSDLISAVLAAAPDTIVVSQSGTPINMLPWANIAKAHIHAWFGGNETGNGIADVIFGKVNPGGKLPLSFPRRIEDNPTFLNFGSERGRVVYGEGIYVGYRYYEKALRDVLYPFGHGLSYTTFNYSNLHVTSKSASVEITNTGLVAGAEVVQLYIAADEATSSIARPKKELKGFSKVFLQPKETKRIEIPFDRFTTAFWDEEISKWVCEKGRYKVLVGSSSQDIAIEGVLELENTSTWSGL